MTRPLLASVLVFTLLVACVPAPTPTIVAVQPSPTSTPSPTLPPAPTNTPSPTATLTSMPAQPPAPSYTSTATPSPAPSPTGTPTPDLDPDGDGVKTKHELKLGTDPDAPDPWREPEFLKATLSTIKLNGVFVRSYYQHNGDKANAAQTHAETSALWSGDSKDLALFVQKNLAHHQADAWLIDVQWNIQGDSSRGQRLPVVRLPDGWWYLSSDPQHLGRVFGPFERLESVAGRFEPRWERILGIDAQGNDLLVIER